MAALLKKTRLLIVASTLSVFASSLVAEQPDSWFHPHRGAAEFEIADFSESPYLTALVDEGKLPPLGARLPNDPVVVEPAYGIGTYGGTARIFANDASMFNAIENPLTIDPDARTVLPNLIESWTLDETGTTFTFTLRRGIKWSDGKPLTSEDFLFVHNHVLLNKELTPFTPPSWVGSNSTRIDDHSFVIEFSQPYPLFINMLAQLGELYIMPAHFMKQYHPDFIDRDALLSEVSELGYISWMSYFRAISLWTRNQQPLAPTVRAFVLERRTPVAEFFTRNPYYWKVDPEGQQLPYIDEVRAEIVENKEILAAKAATGEVDFAAFELKTQDFPLFKLGEQTSGIKTLVWNRIHGSDVIVMPNLNIADPMLRGVFLNFNFRAALSHAINRGEMNDVIYFGRGTPRQATVIPTSKFYEDRFATAYTAYKPDLARSLLDEMDLIDRNGDGLRDYPDGTPLTIVLEYLDFETPKEISIELMTAYWREVGLDIRSKQVDNALQASRAQAGLMQMGVWHADRSTDILFPVEPQWFVPMRNQWEDAHWNEWVTHFLSQGTKGEQPPEDIKALWDNWQELTSSQDESRIQYLGKEILRSTAENLWSIGTVGLAPQPVVVSARLKNVVSNGLWGWDNRWTMPYHPATWYLTAE